MSIKGLIIDNNTKLKAILQIVANKQDVTVIPNKEEQTIEAGHGSILGKVTVTGVDALDGLYVWKKIDTSSITLVTVGDGTYGALNKVALSTFNGNAYYNSEKKYVGVFDKNTVTNIIGCYLTDGATRKIYRIDSYKSPLYTVTSWDSSNYSITKEVIGYAVSDNANAFPDDAVHTDGYYYERGLDSSGAYAWSRSGVSSLTLVTVGDGTAGRVQITALKNCNGNIYYNSDKKYAGVWDMDTNTDIVGCYLTDVSARKIYRIDSLQGAMVGTTIWDSANYSVNKDIIGYVVSDTENKYPDGNVYTDGYYYEKII